MTTAPPRSMPGSGGSPAPTSAISPSSILSQPRSCSVPASSQASGRGRRRGWWRACSRHENRTVPSVDVLTPRTLAEALELKAEHPDALPLQGGTDVMVAINFDRARPEAVLNLNEVPELRGWSRDNGSLRLGAGLTYTEAMSGELASLLPALAEASRTVGSPQIRNRGTIGGNLGTASPAGDSLPPLLVEGAEVECASRARHAPRAARRSSSPASSAPRSRADELISAVWVTPSGAPQTFMKVGPRNAMVIAVVSLALAAGDELRASFGSASPAPGARDRAARRGRLVSPSRSRRQLPRSTTCAAPPPTGGMRCAFSRRARSRGR